MFTKILNIFLLLCLLFCSSSCVTKSLWGDKKYIERFNQFLVGQDGRYVVLVGSNYHYILTDKSGILGKILTLRQEKIININLQKSYLKLSGNNDLQGYLVFEGPFSILPIEDIGTLTSLGIRPNKKDEISIKVTLSGRRYSARNLGQALMRSGSNYQIPVYYRDSNLVKDIGKVAITPVTVGLDAVIFIGKAVVYPFSL
jgi:hypothetical protein